MHVKDLNNPIRTATLDDVRTVLFHHEMLWIMNARCPMSIYPTRIPLPLAPRHVRPVPSRGTHRHPVYLTYRGQKQRTSWIVPARPQTISQSCTLQIHQYCRLVKLICDVSGHPLDLLARVRLYWNIHFRNAHDYQSPLHSSRWHRVRYCI